MNDLIILVNPEYSLTYNNKEYRVRRANMDKVVQYVEEVSKLKGDPTGDFKIAAFCLWLVLKDVEPGLTQADISRDMPGDVEIMELLTTLGFINPKKMEQAKRLQASVINRLTTDNSLPTSANVQDGVPA